MRVEGGVAYLDGKLTLENTAELLEEGGRLMAEGVSAFDLAGLSQVDSSALSLLLGWRRVASSQNRTVRFLNIPDSLVGLAKLYGVAELVDAP
jgi:phospholipid transport system transporter-binding protein